MALKQLLDHLQEFPGFILIGFGKEGKSSFLFLKQYFPHKEIVIADRNAGIENSIPAHKDTQLKIQTGPDYLASLPEEYLILLSPGVKLTTELNEHKGLSSQTELFLRFFGKQTTGITGTKGKSTTSTLLSHILTTAGVHHILLGNIGSPPFDHLNAIQEETPVIFEMSSHQLSISNYSPHIAVLLNLYHEHLDHYKSPHEYFCAKMNIFQHQRSADYLIFNSDNELLMQYISNSNPQGEMYVFSGKSEVEKGIFLRDEEIVFRDKGAEIRLLNARESRLKGVHNLMNMMAAAFCAHLLSLESPIIREGLKSFTGLEHRLEYAGCYQGKHFYNDSIATVPEATIAAVQAIEDIQTLILGGYDRGLDYSHLYTSLLKMNIKHILFTGIAGKRMYDEFVENAHNEIHCYYEKEFITCVKKAVALTEENRVCLLSPAAASYDQFSGFEERGRVYKQIIANS